LYHYIKDQLNTQKASTGKDPKEKGDEQDTERIAMNDRVIDLNMKLSWQSSGPPVPCLVCSARPWVFCRRRDFTGAEALGLQGFDPKSIQHGDTRFSNPDLLSLAGNAMSGFVLAAVFVAIFSTIADTSDISVASRAYSSMLEDLSDEGGGAASDAELISGPSRFEVEALKARIA
jgi:hypothetical protein